MSHRSFSLSDTKNQEMEQRKIRTSPPSLLSPSVKKDEESSKTNILNQNPTIGESEPLRITESLHLETTMPTPRKAKPVKKSESISQGPVLRSKGMPRPTPKPNEPVPEMLAIRRPNISYGPLPSPKPLTRKSLPFNERYERMTTYLEKPLFNRVHELHQQGEFPKIANLLNAAVQEYLDRHFPGV